MSMDGHSAESMDDGCDGHDDVPGHSVEGIDDGN